MVSDIQGQIARHREVSPDPVVVFGFRQPAAAA